MGHTIKLPTVLLVDNDAEMLSTISEFLTHVGYRTQRASSPAEAHRMLKHGPIDLAVIDIRLVDDEDEKDVSGLTLAKETDPAVPKLILTRFPTYQSVREALGPTLEGLPPAVSFVAKQEGLEALLRAVRLALLQFHPALEANLLQAFQTSAATDLQRRMQELGPEEAGRRLDASFEATSAELTQYRESENRRASQYHSAGMITAGLGMSVIVGSLLLSWLNWFEISYVPLVVSALTNAAGLLFFRREDAAHKRVHIYFNQLSELNRLGNLLTACDSLESPLDRATYKKKVIDRLIDTWLVGPAANVQYHPK